MILVIMRTYELMLVVKSDFPHEDEKKQQELLSKLLTEQTVSKTSISFWAKRQLAYEIKKETEGVYLVATIEAETIHVGKLEQQVRLQPQILRYLLTRKEDNA